MTATASKSRRKKGGSKKSGQKDEEVDSKEKKGKGRKGKATKVDKVKVNPLDQLPFELVSEVSLIYYLIRLSQIRLDWFPSFSLADPLSTHSERPPQLCSYEQVLSLNSHVQESLEFNLENIEEENRFTRFVFGGFLWTCLRCSSIRYSLSGMLIVLSLRLEGDWALSNG